MEQNQSMASLTLLAKLQVWQVCQVAICHQQRAFGTLFRQIQREPFWCSIQLPDGSMKVNTCIDSLIPSYSLNYSKQTLRNSAWNGLDADQSFQARSTAHPAPMGKSVQTWSLPAQRSERVSGVGTIGLQKTLWQILLLKKISLVLG